MPIVAVRTEEEDNRRQVQRPLVEIIQLALKYDDAFTAAVAAGYAPSQINLDVLHDEWTSLAREAVESFPDQ